MAITVLNSLEPRLKNHHLGLSPHHALFSDLFSRYINLSVWFPLSEEAKSIIQDIIDKIEGEKTKKVLDLFYGFYDRNFYSVEEIEEKFQISFLDTFVELDEIQRIFDAEKTHILKAARKKKQKNN